MGSPDVLMDVVLLGCDANSAANIRHALMETLFGRARPTALCRGGGDAIAAMVAATAAAQGPAVAQDLAAAAAAQGPATAEDLAAVAVAAQDLAAVAAAAQDLAAVAAAAQDLVPAVAACMCVAEEAGKAMCRRRARRRPSNGAIETCRCLVCGLCWRA